MYPYTINVHLSVVFFSFMRQLLFLYFVLSDFFDHVVIVYLFNTTTIIEIFIYLNLFHILIYVFLRTWYCIIIHIFYFSIITICLCYITHTLHIIFQISNIVLCISFLIYSHFLMNFFSYFLHSKILTSYLILFYLYLNLMMSCDNNKDAMKNCLKWILFIYVSFFFFILIMIVCKMRNEYKKKTKVDN